MNGKDYAFRTSSNFFDAMSPETRERVLESFRNFALSYACATAMGFQPDGRRMPWEMTAEMQDSISAAAFEVAMKAIKEDS